MNDLPSNKKLPFEILLEKIKDSYNTGQNNGTPKICLFLGAGCSRNEIEGGGEIIDLCKSISFFKKAFQDKNNYELLFKDINIEEVKRYKNDNLNDFKKYENEINNRIASDLHNDKKDYIATIPEIYKLNVSKDDLWERYKDLFRQDVQYGMWFKTFSNLPKERQSLLEFLIDDKKPTYKYLLLAHLINVHVFKNIFTTNFDNLVNDSLNYLNIKPKVYAHNEIAKEIDFKGKKPNIIKLHGDYLFENIKNIVEETTNLPDNMNEKLKGALAKEELDLIVIGYNGSDYSVMKCLQEAKGSFDYNLYWCGSKEENLHWRVKTLIKNTQNSYFIEVANFVEFISQTVIKVDIPIDYIKDIVNKERTEIESMVNEMVSSLPKAIKKDVERKLFKLSDANFETVNSLPTLEAKKNYLSRFQFEAIGRVIKRMYDDNRENALTLYEYLDNGKFFQEMIIHSKTPIQYIGNTLCNLNPIDKDRTKSIFKSVRKEIYIRKFESANEGEILSALNELSSIDLDYSNEIGKFISPNSSKNLNDIGLLEFTQPFTKASQPIYQKQLNKYSNDIYLQKIKEEKLLKSITLILDRINSLNPKKAGDILEIISNEDLIEKMQDEDCTLKQIGIAIKCYRAINPIKTRVLLNEIPDELLIKKIQSSSLMDIAMAFLDLKDIKKTGINNDKIHNIFVKHNDNFYVNLIHNTPFTEMANSLAKLHNINYRKVWHILDKLNKNILITNLDNDTFKFEEFGSALLNLIKIEKDKEQKIFPDVFANSNIHTLAEAFSNDAKKLKEKVFVTYFPFLIDMHEDLACKMAEHLRNSQVFSNLIKWIELDTYTSALPRFLYVFDQVGMTKEAKDFATFICFHQKYLKTKYSATEIETIKTVLRKYTTCK